MTPWLIKLLPVLLTTLGQVLLSFLVTLLQGKVFKEFLLLPLEWLSERTKSTTDDKLVDLAREDLGLPPQENKEDNGKPNETT